MEQTANKWDYIQVGLMLLVGAVVIWALWRYV